MNNEVTVFRNIVERIFTNWTALQLAIEHGMGGPTGKETAIEVMDYMVSYCLGHSNLNSTDLVEVLEDIMDQEFETLCEDNSPQEIAALLLKFQQLLRNGDSEQLELEFNSLPTCKLWLSKQQKPLPVVKEDDEEPSTSASGEIPMEEDTEWTQVKSRRKK